MTSFPAIDVARTGAGLTDYWMDTISHNVANANTVTSPDAEPFRARHVVAQTLPGGLLAEGGSGAAVGNVLDEAGEPALVHAPDHPLADEDGYVARPVMDLAAQFADLIQAQRGYQMNLRVAESARESYESALRLGQA